MVDRILQMTPGESAVGIKVLAANEPFFAGHFPGNPIMPGVLQIEAICQVGEYALLSDERFAGKLAFITGCNKVRFKSFAVPGDVLVISTEVIEIKGNTGSGRGKIEINGRVVCEAEISFFVETAGA